MYTSTSLVLPLTNFVILDQLPQLCASQRKVNSAFSMHHTELM